MKNYRFFRTTLLWLFCPVGILVFAFGIDRTMPLYSVIAQLFAISFLWLLMLNVVLFYAVAGRIFFEKSYWFLIFPIVAFAYVGLCGIGAADRSGVEIVIALSVMALCYGTLFRRKITSEIESLAKKITSEFVQEFGFRMSVSPSHFEFLPTHIGVLLLLAAFGVVPALR
jgi:hypothetical protein